MKYVRWLNAFGGYGYSLKAKIEFEMTRKDEAACEAIHSESRIASKGSIGVLLNKEAIFRTFKSDCWSFYGQDLSKHRKARKDQDPKRLYTAEPNRHSNHNEAWAHMDKAIVGIVVNQMNIWELSSERRNTLLNASRKYGIAVYRLVHGRLQKEQL